MKYSTYNIFVNSDTDILLVNTFSGAVFKIDEKVHSLVNSNIILDLNESDYNAFMESGVIISDDLDELKALTHTQNYMKYCSTTLSLTILLTSDCNFRCTYCFEGTEKQLVYLTETTKGRIRSFVNNSVASSAWVSGCFWFGSPTPIGS